MAKRKKTTKPQPPDAGRDGTEFLKSLHDSSVIRCIALSAVAQDNTELIGKATNQFVDLVEGLMEGFKLLSGPSYLEPSQLSRLRRCHAEFSAIINRSAEWLKIEDSKPDLQDYPAHCRP